MAARQEEEMRGFSFCPGRWTTHVVLGAPEAVDGELLGWVGEAYRFAAGK